MQLSKTFLIYFFLTFIFYASKIYAQPLEEIEFQGHPLNSANKYVQKKRFTINNWGDELPYLEDNVTIFFDKINIRQIHYIRKNKTSQNICIIANSIYIGDNNLFDSESNVQSKNENSGGSLVLICKKLIIDVNSKLIFIGGSESPQKFTFEGGTFFPNFENVYGAQLLIATENLEFSDNFQITLNEYFLNRIKSFLEKGIGKTLNDWPNSRLKDLIYVTILNLETKNLFSASKLIEYKKLLSDQISYKNIDTALHIIKLGLDLFPAAIPKLDQIISRTFDNKNIRKPYSLYAIPPKPFNDAIPFLDAFLPTLNVPSNYDWKLYDFDKIPIIIQPSPTAVYLNTYQSNPSEVIFPQSLETVGFLYGPNALRTLPTSFQALFSQWALEWIRYKKTQALQAKALGNRPAFFNILREIAEMPRYQLDDPYDGQYDAVNTQMLALLAEAQNLVSEKQLVLDAPLAGSPVSVLAQGIPAKYFLPPSEVLLNGIHSNNNWYYGIVQNVNTTERLTRLTLQGELKADPLLAKAVMDKLNTSENAVLQSGQLPNLLFNLNGVTGEGIKRFNATVSGSVVNLTLDIDPDAVAQVMFRFATTGFPYYLEWTVPGDPVQKGQLDQPLLLRLSRRTGGRIYINGTQVRNEENTSTAKISYVRTSSGRILPFKELSVKPKETATLTDIALQAGEYLVDVPDMGIFYDDGNFESAIGRFLVMPGNAVIDNVTVSNKIPATITMGTSGLRYQVRNVEIEIALIDPETQVAQPFTHSFLSPEGSQGSTLSAQTPRLATVSNKYRITGKVYFTDGGSAQLKPTEYNSPIINLTVDEIKLL